MRKPKGLNVRGITSCPAYLKGKEEIFNLRRIPRNATDKGWLAQVPTPFVTVGSEDPREGAPRV